MQGEIQAVRDTGKLDLPGGGPVVFSVDDDIVLHRRKRLDFHTNGMRFHALDAAGNTLCRREYFSVGGGFVLGEDETGAAAVVVDPTPVPYPFLTGGQLLAHVTARPGCRSAESCSPTRLSGDPNRRPGTACCGSGR